jgi:copper chaperone
MKHKVHIQNLKCGGCAHTITSELGKLDGVTDVIVDENTDAVSFKLDGEDISNVVRRLDELGYPIENEPNSLFKKAKSYVSCAVGRINKD